MHALPNGCTCSDLSVNPKNWQSLKASTKKPWYVFYRFYDPNFKNDPKFKKGKLKLIKTMNRFSNLVERQDAVRVILEDEWGLLKNNSYNPITEQMEEPLLEVHEYEIHPDTPFATALRQCQEQLKKAKATVADIKSMLNFLEKAIAHLRYSSLPIKSVTRKHIRALLDYMPKVNPLFSDHRFNKYRSYLMILFSELIEMEATEINPVTGIKKRITVKRIRQRLTLDERRTVNQHLQKVNPEFWRFMNIFFHAGARETELTELQRKDVDLKNQRYKVTIRKGNTAREVWKPIKDIALGWWQKAMAEERPRVFNNDNIPPELRAKYDTKELLQLNAKDINLAYRRFKVVKHKRRIEPVIIWREIDIKDISLWKNALKNESDYLFSRCLLPGIKAINPRQISRKWHFYVKDVLGIEADFYSLKHVNLDEVAEILSLNEAAKLASHTSTVVTMEHYTLGETDRQHERIKKVANKLA